MLHNVFKKKSQATTNDKENPKNPRTKLQGYHEIVKEIIEKGYAADINGESEKAQELYRRSLQIIDEALSINVQSSGLSSIADNVSMWKRDLNDWKTHVSERLADFDPSSKVLVKQQKPKATRINRKNTHTKSKTPAPVAPAKKANSSDNNKFKDIIMGEILVSTSNLKWSDVSGLETAKQALYESVVLPVLRPELFQGLRSPPRGILLYGPPGNGKTFIAKALANEAQATFFNISASSLTSKWVGEGEKLVRTLFEVASEYEPSIIFIDEIDSILTERTSEESGALRRLKTEFLLQFDGVASSQGNIVVIGATNRPHDLDDAARRRLIKRIYVPLPSHQTRTKLISNLISNQKNVISSRDVNKLADETRGYSASDLTALCKEAALSILREMGDKVLSIDPNAIRPLKKNDVIRAMNIIKPSVNTRMLESYEDFTRKYGTQ